MHTRITNYLFLFFSLTLVGHNFAQNTVLVAGKERKASDKIHVYTKAEEIAQNEAARNKATTCGGTTAAAVSLQTCASVGTAGFYTTGTNQNATSSAATVPGVAETCAGTAGYDNGGTWLQLNPDNGVNILDLQITSGSVASGNHTVYVQFFQGASCAALTAIGCSELTLVTMGLRIPVNVHQENVNPSQNVWMYIWDDSGKAFNLNMEVIGSSNSTITNDDCAGASTDDAGCNLGAGPESWTGPSANGKTCTGGTWYSNENTVYFSFTADAATGSIGVNGILCNEGTAGQAQFGVWNNCGCVGTYTAACFRSCAVGTGTLSLSSMTPGATYIIAVDGQAGDICTWGFTTTGITIPVELLKLNASTTPSGNLLSWTTGSERECAYFIIERSEDGENFYPIGERKGHGNSSEAIDYSFLDNTHGNGINYYRLIQVDTKGEKTSYIPVKVDNQLSGMTLVPNPVNEAAKLTFGSDFEGNSIVEIIDFSGKVISKFDVKTNKGTNQFDLDTRELSNGLYLIKLSNEKEQNSLKFMK